MRVYDDQLRNDKLARTDPLPVFERRNKGIPFFQAGIMHEVTPVQVPAKGFRDGWFTVNGWIQRA